ncbi:barstar family protein [Streptomyces collinus]
MASVTLSAARLMGLGWLIAIVPSASAGHGRCGHMDRTLRVRPPGTRLRRTNPWSCPGAERRDGHLVVDLRGQSTETLDDFWDAVTGPCGLPEWFGRNTDAWRDTVQTRGISEVIDRYDVLVVHVTGRVSSLRGTVRQGRCAARSRTATAPGRAR